LSGLQRCVTSWSSCADLRWSAKSLPEAISRGIGTFFNWVGFPQRSVWYSAKIVPVISWFLGGRSG
jgi:hypothetical protein